MRVAIEAGAEIDIPTQKEIRDIMNNVLKADEPVVKKLRISGVMPSAGVLTLDFGLPPAGKYWDLRSLFVSGTDPTATVTSAKAILGVGMAPVTGTLTTNLDASSIYQLFTTVPGQNTFSKDEVTILTQEHLFVCFSGAANNTILVAGVQVVASNYGSKDGVSEL